LQAPTPNVLDSRSGITTGKTYRSFPFTRLDISIHSLEAP
jgi:hypothetical protein